MSKEKTNYCIYEIRTKKIFSDPIISWTKISDYKNKLNEQEGFKKYDIAVVIEYPDGRQEFSPEGLIIQKDIAVDEAADLIE